MINKGFMLNGNLECELSIGKGEKGEDGLTTSISVNGETYTHVDGNIKLPDYPSIKGLATENYVKSEIVKAQLGGGDSEIDLSGYATKDDLSSKADKTELPTKISELINDTNFISGIPSEYITELELDSKGYVTEQYVKNEISKAQLEGEDIDLSAYALKTELHNHNNKTILDEITSDKVNEWNNKSSFDGNYNSLTNKPNIPSIEGLATETFVRNEIANAQLGGGDSEIDLSGYATKDDLSSKVDKVEGYSLVLDSEITRLSKVDNYIHPNTHTADMILFADGETFQNKLNNGSLKGEKGDKGEQGIQGEQGVRGDKGDKGEQGNAGIDGITPNISIGNVTVLDAGQKATVTRRGTDATPIFDFGIPRGEKGEDGLSYDDSELRNLISELSERVENFEGGYNPPVEDENKPIIVGAYCGQMNFKTINNITIEDLQSLTNVMDVVKPQTTYSHSKNTVFNKTLVCAIPKSEGTILNVVDGAGADITNSYPIVEKTLNGVVYSISCNKVAQAYNRTTTVKFNIGSKASSTPDDDEAVEETIKCTSITLDDSSISLSVDASADKMVLIPTVEPVNTTDEIIWTTANAGIATVNNGIVSAVGGTGGTTTITARCGDQVATCSVKVTTSAGTGTGTGGTGTGGASSYVTVFDVLQDEYIFNTINATDTQTMAPYIKPATSSKAKTYKSSNNNIATISSSGVITPISEGECTIYACCGSFVVSSKVIVHIPTQTYNSPTITIENFKAKVEQDGHIEYFDLSYEPNTGHPYYAGYKELTDSEGTRYYLALLNKGTSKFRIDGLIPANGGWMSLSHHDGTNYILTFESAIYPQYNDWNLEYDIRIKNNSISQEFVQHALNNVNASFDALNITINESSNNIMELADYAESWIGLLDFHTPSGTRPAYYEVLLNKSVINSTYGVLDVNNKNSDTYKYWLSTTVHEFGHTLGIRDNSMHLPTMYSYSRNLLKCNYLQPNDMYVIRHFWKDMFNKDVPSKRASVSKRTLAFEYPNYSDNQLANNSDVVVNAKLKPLRVEDINVGGDLVIPYNVYEIVPSEIEKGNLINPELKIYTNEKLVIDEDKKYKLYLKQYDNVPCSLINLDQGIKEMI